MWKDGQLTSEGRLLAGVMTAFLTVALLAAVDMVADLAGGTTFRHVAFEGALVLLGLGGAALMARRLAGVLATARVAREEAVSLAARLEDTREEARRWRQQAHRHLRGLAQAIDAQLERWELTAAEKEVALLLLKGLSHKEIAEARGVGEATARQQARAVYRKAGLSGRNDLAAFFLEDLMVPYAEDEPPLDDSSGP